mmetsp:Transcript_50326/g.93055  ORF Transcript_50326/g.93055 Transcript_50326/m.93055 type:complete len:324 (+) Transcript_50326:66-1037(+)
MATIGDRPGRDRTAWADVFSSSENLDEASQEPPPVVEDTYESQGFGEDLPKALITRACLEAPARSASSMSVTDDSMAVSGAATAAPVQNGMGAPSVPSRLSATAPEFVPRASGGQTLEEVAAVATASASSSENYAPARRMRQKRPSWTAGTIQPQQRALKRSRGVGDLTLVEEDDAMEAAPTSGSSGTSGGPAGRSSPAGQPGPTGGTASATDRSPPRGSPARGSPSRGSAGNAMQAQPRPAIEGGEATEEDWQRRIEKRRGAISNFKEGAEYQAYSAKRSRGDPAVMQVPGTPDPEDREVSKRSWETAVAGWRNLVKESVAA